MFTGPLEDRVAITELNGIYASLYRLQFNGLPI